MASRKNTTTTAKVATKSAASADLRRDGRVRPCVLAIGGLDPGGGAGILADARAIAEAGAFACAAVAVVTVQSTAGMRSARAVPKKELVAQAQEVLRHQRVAAFKIGALGSEENTRAVADLLGIHRNVPAIVDTVMMPSRGSARLLEEKALSAMRDRLLPRAALVMCNAPEAEVLTGRRVTRLDEAHDAALALLKLGARAVLVKGGHLGGSTAVDLLALAPPYPPERQSMRSLKAAYERRATAAEVIEITAPRLKLGATHGGGCVLASLVAGRLAAEGPLGDAILQMADAVRWSKALHHEALKNASDVGGDMRVLLA